MVSLLTATSCNGGEGKSGSKVVTLVYETDKREYWNSIKEGFEEAYKEEGYTLNMIPVGGGQVISKQSTMISQNDAPDLILGGDVHIQNQYKYLMPLNELIDRDSAEVDYKDFIPAVTDVLTLNNKVYYLPDFFNVSLLYYNKTIFDKYNGDPAHASAKIEYPNRNWDYYEDFYATAEKLTDTARGQFGCFSTIGWWGEWLTHIRQSGGEIMNDEGYVTLNTQAANDGIFRYYEKMYGSAQRKRISNQKGTDDNYGDFSIGHFAMDYGGHIVNWVPLRSETVDFDWDVEFLPTVNGNRAGGELAVNAYGIYAGTDAKDATWELLKYMTRKRSLEEWQATQYPSCRISGKDLLLSVPKAERKQKPQNLEAVYLSLENSYCKSLPGERYFEYINTQIIQNYITKILENEYSNSDSRVNISEGLKKATDAANNYIRSNYKT